MNQNALTNRHDFLLLFDVTNGNPNGDPDVGNVPRHDPNTYKGIVSDVCLKRKVRNYVFHFPPASQNGEEYGVFIQQGGVLNDLINEAEPHASANHDAARSRDLWELEALSWLCNKYFDLRAFGAVLATKNKVFKGSSYGQVRGPVQFTFAQSYDPIRPLEISITRCAATNAEEKKSIEEAEAVSPGSGRNRTMGNKHIVPYALYAAKGYVSPAFAERTNFTQSDLDLLFKALLHMFEHDRSAARGEMVVRGLYDFEHVGTQGPENADQNKREARLGCAHAHKLFEGVKVRLKEGREFPQSFDDYEVICEWTEENLPNGVKMHKRHEG